MAFINERITEEDKKRINFDSIEDPRHEKPVRPYKWTIDRDRNVFFMYLGSFGSDPDNPGYYLLSIDGEIIHIRMIDDCSGDVKDGIVCSWHLSQIRIPDHLQHRREEIIQVLKEALDAYGLIYDRTHVRAVHFDF